MIERIVEAQQGSYRTCEVCGGPGEQREAGGRVETGCDASREYVEMETVRLRGRGAYRLTATATTCKGGYYPRNSASNCDSQYDDGFVRWPSHNLRSRRAGGYFWGLSLDTGSRQWRQPGDARRVHWDQRIMSRRQEVSLIERDFPDSDIAG